MGRRSESEFAAFAASCRPALRRTAFLMCGDWDRAADITQEAMIRVYVASRLRSYPSNEVSAPTGCIDTHTTHQNHAGTGTRLRHRPPVHQPCRDRGRIRPQVGNCAD